MRGIAILLLIAPFVAGLAGCVDPPTPLRPPAAFSVGPSGPVPLDGAGSVPTAAPILTPLPGFPQLQPEIGAGSPTRQPYNYEPGSTVAPIPAPAYRPPGPITGYGPGGMAYPPGAAPNPPYFYGGVPR